MIITPYPVIIQLVSPMTTILHSLKSNVNSNRNNRGTVSITFDDGLKNQFDYAFPLMKARKIKGTFYITTDKIRDFSHDQNFMSLNELKILQNDFNEIGSHSKTHRALTSLSDEQIHKECRVSIEVLQSYGFPAENFAYPYGKTNEHVNSIVSQYFLTCRSAYKRPYMIKFLSSNKKLPGYPGEKSDSSAFFRLKHLLKIVALTNSYAIVFFHNVLPNMPSNSKTTSRQRIVSSQAFSNFLDYGVSKGVQFLTVSQALPTLPFSSNNGGIKSNFLLH